MKRIGVAAAVVVMVAGLASGARLDPVPVPPVEREGIRYEAPHDDGRRGYVVAHEAESGREIWEQTIYRVPIDLRLEGDLGLVFIASMEVQGGNLKLTDERGRRFLLDLRTREVTGPSPDGDRAGPFDLARQRMERVPVRFGLSVTWVQWYCVLCAGALPLLALLPREDPRRRARCLMLAFWVASALFVVAAASAQGQLVIHFRGLAQAAARLPGELEARVEILRQLKTWYVTPTLVFGTLNLIIIGVAWRLAVRRQGDA